MDIIGACFLNLGKSKPVPLLKERLEINQASL